MVVLIGPVEPAVVEMKRRCGGRERRTWAAVHDDKKNDGGDGGDGGSGEAVLTIGTADGRARDVADGDADADDGSDEAVDERITGCVAMLNTGGGGECGVMTGDVAVVGGFMVRSWWGILNESIANQA